MQKNPYEQRIPEGFRRAIVTCVSNGLLDFHDHWSGVRLDTKNFVQHTVANYVNIRLKDHMYNDTVLRHMFKRHSWDGRLIIDTGNHMRYSLHRKGSFEKAYRDVHLRKNDKPYYPQTMAYVDNKDFSNFVQPNFYGDVEPAFDDATFQSDYDTIISGADACEEGWHYAPIIYDTRDNKLTDIRICFFDRNFNEVGDWALSLNEFLTPDFSDLTGMPADGILGEYLEIEGNHPLISINKDAIQHTNTKEKGLQPLNEEGVPTLTLVAKKEEG